MEVSPCPQVAPNLDLMWRASLRRVTSASGGSGGRLNSQSGATNRNQSATINRNRKRSRNEGSETDLESTSSRPRSQTADLDYLFDVDFKRFDDNYSLSDDDRKPADTANENRSQRVYRRACKLLGVAPSTVFTAALRGQSAILKHRSLGPADIKACALALAVNTSLEMLDFSDNEIGLEGANCISQVLAENVFISDLSLAECRLSSRGMVLLAEAMRNNDTLKRLDISGNGLVEQDAEYLADILRNNDTIKDLIVGHNCFRERGGQILGPALADNTSLETLDLSWNHLRRAGAVAICKGLEHNIGLHQVNLAWNGLHFDGCQAMARVLANNVTILDLDLTCNRIDRRSLDELCKGVTKTETLQTLKVGNNPMTTGGATALLALLETKPEIPIRHLDLSGQSVDKDFLNQLERLRMTRPIEVHHGAVMRIEELLTGEEKEQLLHEDPMTVLMEFMRLRNIRVVDLFAGVEEDSMRRISQEEFTRGLQKANIPLSSQALAKLVRQLASDGTDQIDMSEWMRGQEEHEKKLAALQEDDTQQAFEETSLGRLSARLQTLISVRHVLHQKPANDWHKPSKMDATIDGATQATRPPFRPAGENILRSAIGQLTQHAGATSSKINRQGSVRNDKDDSVFSSPTGARTPSGRLTPSL